MATRFFSLLIEAGTKDIYLYIDILKTKKNKTYRFSMHNQQTSIK